MSYRMERHLRRDAHQAHREEVRAERQEARLHNRAVNAALHGNFGKALNLEARSNAAHHRAEQAHQREVASNAAANAVHHHHGPPPPMMHHHHHQPPHHFGPRPHTDVHVVHLQGGVAPQIPRLTRLRSSHKHYTPAPAGYPTGTAPPPPQPPYAGYPPAPGYPPSYPR